MSSVTRRTFPDDHHRSRPRGNLRDRRSARARAAAGDLVPLLEQLRAALGQEAGRDRPALHQGHRHQDQDRPHPRRAAGGQVRLRGADAGRPRHGRDAHALPVALRAAAGGRLRHRRRAGEEARQGHLLGRGDGQGQGRLAGGAPVPHVLRVRLPRGPLQEGEPQGARHLGGPLQGRQGAEEDGAPGRDPHQPELRHDLDRRGRPVVPRRHGGRQGRQDRPDQLAGRPPRCVEWYRKMYRDCMEPEVLSWTDASNNESLQQGKAGWIHNPVSAYIVARRPEAASPPTASTTIGRLAGPGGPPRDRRAAPHRDLEVLEERRAVQGVDPLFARQEGGLRRVHHVG